MKKIVSLLLAVLFAFSLLSRVGCGKINDASVAILWSGDGVATDPNSLINSMDRAMYIEKIAYEHYGAKGDAALQLKQAKDALDAGCAALVVEPVVADIAQEIVDAAKAKDVPVIFVKTAQNIPQSVVDSYDKCVTIVSDTNTLSEVEGKLIADYIKANFKKLDKNQDGKITYYASDYYDLTRISVFAVDKANELLATEDYVVKGADKKEINTFVEPGNIVEFDHKNIDPTEYELILTIDDQAAFEVLCMLQEKGYNTDKLTTHFVPVITLGDTVDYKAYVVEQGKDKYEENKYLVDLTTVSEEDLEAMIYTTRNVISAGRLAGTVIADDDAIAGAAAKIVANLIKGKDKFDGVASEVKEGEAASVVVDGASVKVRFIALTE